MNNNTGTRKSYQEWLAKNAYMSYTRYSRLPAAEKNALYAKYNKGERNVVKLSNESAADNNA